MTEHGRSFLQKATLFCQLLCCSQYRWQLPLPSLLSQLCPAAIAALSELSYKLSSKSSYDLIPCHGSFEISGSGDPIALSFLLQGEHKNAWWKKKDKPYREEDASLVLVHSFRVWVCLQHFLSAGALPRQNGLQCQEMFCCVLESLRSD